MGLPKESPRLVRDDCFSPDFRHALEIMNNIFYLLEKKPEDVEMVRHLVAFARPVLGKLIKDVFPEREFAQPSTSDGSSG